MIRRPRSILLFVAMMAVLAPSPPGRAQEGQTQETRKQEPNAKPRPARPNQKAAVAEKADEERQPETSEEALQRAVSGLANQIGILTSELRRLRQETERTSATIELLLYEERLAKVEEKIEDAIERKVQFDAREQELQRRMKNIQQEVALRGGLRRDEGEAALRAEFQRTLEDTRNQQANYQQRIAELQTQADRLRKRVEALRKKLEPPEEKSSQ